MSIASELVRLGGNIALSYSACVAKGATMPQEQSSDNLPSTISSIPNTTDLSDATAVADDIAPGKTAYGASGKLTGTMTDLDAIEFGELTVAEVPASGYAAGDNLEDIAEAINERAAYGGGGLTVEPLSVTANGTYTAPSGKAYNEVTVDVDDPDALEVEALTAEHNGLYVPESGHAYSSARVHVTTRVTGTGDLMIFVTAPTGCTVTAEKLDGEDEGALYTGVESQETAGEYTIKVSGYGQYEVSATPQAGSSVFSVEPATVTVVKPDCQLATIVPLEYIESTRTQYVNTGLSMPNGFAFETTIEWLSYSTFDLIFGSQFSERGLNFFGQANAYYGGEIVALAGLASTGGGNIAPLNEKVRYDVSTIASGYHITRNGIEQELIEATPLNPPAADLPLYLFASNNYNSASWPCNCRIYDWFRVWSDVAKTNLVADFRPAKRIGADGTADIGLYDIVRNQFFTNAGTGTFIAGPELT